MSLLKGCFLVPTTKNPDKSLWFIFHHESDGILAFDVTKEHPDIPYKHFETVLDAEDKKSSRDKIVLLGGPRQTDSGMIVLHNQKSAPNSHDMGNNLFLMSYRFVLLPGKPPMITRSDDQPTRLALNDSADFIVAMGFRLWEMAELEAELKDWQWTLLPATPEILFHTPRENRLQKALLSIN